MHSHHYARHLPQRFITLCHLPINPTIIHILISILIRRPQILYNFSNTCVIPLLHRILTTQFIYTYANITKKSPLKSPKHKNILFFNNNT
ncbi:CDA_G0047580.mRNA.1.CDS.1 [Saccharomyces cerevisiae]|nr:CDA_G0047580.mRNA.1.CDS.1 [Saccharomyces cerevisiae]CAI7451763.1 CDA_G0047580.mRNA.1.CDS.1 [Saccharomyces cerevisiae]